MKIQKHHMEKNPIMTERNATVSYSVCVCMREREYLAIVVIIMGYNTCQKKCDQENC